MVTLVCVFLGAAVGAPLRYLTDRAMRSHQDTLLPWGTMTVNVLGSLALGALAGLDTAVPDPWRALLGIGFCGAFTTYSTFGWETLRLAEQRAYPAAAANVVISVLAGAGAALLGYTVLHAIAG